ncbi:MAG: Coenzyme F420 hydrogenase/dehydrogenase, beta subunit C-terminal domain [Planctomycetota bacterium]
MTLRRKRRCRTAEQVAAWRLCMGCGACVPACPNNAVRLVDLVDQGIRPVADSQMCEQCGRCVAVCPGVEISHVSFREQTIPELRESWGPILEMWEGYAGDPEIRFKGSSGGAATALALFSLENEKISGVLHTGTGATGPLRNVPVLSKSREDLLAHTGSRYSPAAPCAKIDWIMGARSPVVFIGKPCDVVALRKSQAANPALKDKVCLAISIFCAGTPTTEGTNEILSVLDVAPEQIEEFRYRGCGWPGMTTAKLTSGNGPIRQMSYEQSWGNILSKHGQTRCRLCPDSTGEFADVSCGDPWYRQIEPGEQGWSLVLARTERGKEILHAAIEAGYIKLERVDSSVLPLSQKALLDRRRHLWGRLLTMHMMRIPAPCYKGFSLFDNWLRLPFGQKLRSFAGTFKRIILRGWMRPLKPVARSEQLPDSGRSEEPVIDLDESEVKCKL